MSFSKTRQSSVPQRNGIAVVVDTLDKRLIEESQGIIQLLGKDGQESPEESMFTLFFGRDGIELRLSQQVRHSGKRVDFLTIDRRIGTGNLSKKQPLPKAIGEHTAVIDATAGFGMDAARLALMGYTVTAIEQSPIISAMLRDGLWRAEMDAACKEALGGRLTIIESDSTQYLQHLKGVEVVYIDPMFPPKRKKSALPPGHIQALQSIVGFEDPVKTKELFNIALQTATQRVVVKRPLHAPQIASNPTTIHEGKIVRYEVYRSV